MHNMPIHFNTRARTGLFTFHGDSCFHWSAVEMEIFTIQDTLNIINYDSFFNLHSALLLFSHCSQLSIVRQIFSSPPESRLLIMVVNTSTYHFCIFFPRLRSIEKKSLFVHPHYRHFKSYMIAFNNIPSTFIFRTIFHFC